MNTYQQRRNIDFHIPKRGTRLAGMLVDFLVLIIANIIAFKFWGVKQEDGSYRITGQPAFLLFLFMFSYLVLPEIITGRTLGKWLAGLKVLSIDGTDASPKQVIIRHLCDIVDWTPGFFIVFFIVTSNNKNRQRVGDMAAKTVVIQEK